MYRMITEFLEACKESEHRKPLILHGARLPKASAVRTIKNCSSLCRILYLISYVASMIALKNHPLEFSQVRVAFLRQFYILSGASKPSTSMQVSSTFCTSRSSAIQEACCSSFSSVRILVSW